MTLRHRHQWVVIQLSENGKPILSVIGVRDPRLRGGSWVRCILW